MNARVLGLQADLFEIAVLSQTVEVQTVSMEQLLDAPAGPPLVIIGSLLAADRLAEVRRLSSVLGRARVSVLVAPPFSDPDLGRYFETPVQLRAKRRSPESVARILDRGAVEALGEELRVRSDHVFETALGAGVVAVDPGGRPVLIRYQATNTAGPVFFSALQLLTYTALTDEGQRQELLAHLLSWSSTLVSDAPPAARSGSAPSETAPVPDGVLVHVALLLAAGSAPDPDQLRARGQALLGADMTSDDVRGALDELARRGLVVSDLAAGSTKAALGRFLEERGLHPYVRELAELLASGDAP